MVWFVLLPYFKFVRVQVRGYVSTARKNGLNALDALRRVFTGDPFVPAINTS